MGQELREIANEISANHDLILVETSAGLRGGADLQKVLRSESDRDYIRWRHELVSDYLAYVSARLGVEIEIVEQPVIS